MKGAVPACLQTAVIMIAAGPAVASPPPPPPAYIWEAEELLIDSAVKDQTKIARYFAENVSASVNGQPIADGKTAWLDWWSSSRSHYYGRTLAYSEGWTGAGALLVFDEYDTKDYSAKPPPPGDPRPSTRSTLYVFGADHLIHSIEITEVNSFTITPSTQHQMP